MIVVCNKCKETFETFSGNKKLCDTCQKDKIKNYMREYMREYARRLRKNPLQREHLREYQKEYRKTHKIIAQKPLPCPKCSSNSCFPTEAEDTLFVQCMSCGHQGGFISNNYSYSSEFKAIKKWNQEQRK